MTETIDGKAPVLKEGAAVHALAYVSGNVVLGEGSSVFPGASVRGDMAAITLGKCSNVQDNATLHTTEGIELVVGDYVTVGHNAVLHSARVGDNTIIGMGAIVLDGAVVGKNCIIGAGCVIAPGKHVPDGSIAVGNPFRILRELRDSDIAANRKNAEEYVMLSRRFAGG